ncbi:MAG: capsular biosynthesis protein [Bacteroidales bacterium]|nr:capsular biosynthesis protein [Bacteroidales bacterium]
MGLFGTMVQISASLLQNGFTDWHCHLLPGVDDGVQTAEESIRILDAYERAGIRDVWFTPHIMEDIPNTTAFLRERFVAFQLEYTGGVHLHLAAENMLDSLFEERLRADDFLPLASRRLLVETSYFNPPYNLHGILKQVASKGYFPMLAHPERYVYMSPQDYRTLKDMGVQFQLNVPSLYGAYGPEVKARAEHLLRDGYYDICGTDCHREGAAQRLLQERLKKKIVRQIPVQGL